MAFKTRDRVSCKLRKLIGKANKFLESKLPTLKDNLKYGLFLRKIEENDDILRQTFEKV